MTTRTQRQARYAERLNRAEKTLGPEIVASMTVARAEGAEKHRAAMQALMAKAKQNRRNRR